MSTTSLPQFSQGFSFAFRYSHLSRLSEIGVFPFTGATSASVIEFCLRTGSIFPQLLVDDAYNGDYTEETNSTITYSKVTPSSDVTSDVGDADEAETSDAAPPPAINPTKQRIASTSRLSSKVKRKYVDQDRQKVSNKRSRSIASTSSVSSSRTSKIFLAEGSYRCEVHEGKKHFICLLDNCNRIATRRADLARHHQAKKHGGGEVSCATFHCPCRRQKLVREDAAKKHAFTVITSKGLSIPEELKEYAISRGYSV